MECKADESQKFDQKINRTNAVAMTKDILIAMFFRTKYRRALEAFDDNVSSTREIIRPDRHEKINHRPKKAYSLNYNKL